MANNPHYEDKVYVRPIDDPTGSIPSWIGEEIPVPYEIAQELAQIRGFAEEKHIAAPQVNKLARCFPNVTLQIKKQFSTR